MIDSSLFYAEIPAGTYSPGDVVQLSIKDGPANVRSGRGSAILKRMMGFIVTEKSGAASYWRIHIKNSDWIDDAIVTTGDLSAATILDQHSGSVRIGNNSSLTPNSSWQVYAECIMASTTTIKNGIFALIDIDYPQVAAVTDPDALIGLPASIPYTANVQGNAPGDVATAAWNVFNVDIFKAGYQYALQEIGMFSPTTGGDPRGFIKISNAAGMSGLSRIVPVSAAPVGIKETIEYASLLVKGPMDISYMIFNSGAASALQIDSILDFVKRKI